MGVAVVLLTLMSLCVFRGMGVLMVVLLEIFKWSRTQISFGALLSRVEGAALGPIVSGYTSLLVDEFLRTLERTTAKDKSSLDIRSCGLRPVQEQQYRATQLTCKGLTASRSGGDTEAGEDFFIPSAGVDVEDECAGGVADVNRMNATSGQFPDQPTVHGAEAGGGGHVGPGPPGDAAGMAAADQQRVFFG